MGTIAQGRWLVVPLLALAAPLAAAQSIEGPLVDPVTPTHPLTQPAAVPARKRHKHADKPLATARDIGGGAPFDPAPAPLPAPHPRHAAAPADPISLGFKWRGSNDTAEKTRVQNYSGDAGGTGAAVGLKLHF